MKTIEIGYIGGTKIKIDKQSALYQAWGGSFDESGGFAINEVTQIYEYLKDMENPVFIDVGANTGSHSFLSLVHPTLVCFAFEPIPQFYEILKTNLKLNNLEKKVYAFNLALSDKPGFLNFEIQSGTAHMNINGNIQVLAVPLDIFGFERVDYIKIDTDGHDYQVLEGAKETLKRCKPRVLYEGYQDNERCTKFMEEIHD